MMKLGDRVVVRSLATSRGAAGIIGGERIVGHVDCWLVDLDGKSRKAQPFAKQTVYPENTGAA